MVKRIGAPTPNDPLPSTSKVSVGQSIHARLPPSYNSIDFSDNGQNFYARTSSFIVIDA